MMSIMMEIKSSTIFKSNLTNDTWKERQDNPFLVYFNWKEHPTRFCRKK